MAETASRPSTTGARRSPYRSVLRLRNYRRLWLGMSVSSLGDWVGLFALLSITNRLAPKNTLAIAGLMVFRVLPAFLVGPLAGVAVDRVDRRKAMVVCDLIRAALIACVPLVRTLPLLYVIAFALETISLFWMPAKDALVPQLVPNRWLVTANSLALFTTYGVFPLGALAFTALVGVAQFLGDHVGALGSLSIDQEHLALWIDTATFLASAALVWRIAFPGLPPSRRPLRLRAVVEELVEGLRYLGQQRDITRVIRGIGVALVGGAVVFSLGAPYVSQVLGGGAKGFGGMVTLAGAGVGVGVLVLGALGDRLPKPRVFALSMIAVGGALLAAAVVSSLALALVVALVLGAFAGMAYATGFALVQETVDERLLGRTMASLQVVIRISLLGSLVAFPALAKLLAHVGPQHSVAEGIRLAFALGGLTTIAAGTLAARDVYLGRMERSS